jgi:ferredoxin
MRAAGIKGFIRAKKRSTRMKILNELAIAVSGPHYCGPIKANFMADAANKYPENITGKYYVDNQCIDCDLCRETAPDNFKRNDDGGYSFVYKQPENPDEEARCKEAKEGCPVEAIGDNG